MNAPIRPIQPIRMIAVDLDGTLLNSQKIIAPEDRAALCAAAARGVEIVPVTGRSYSTALPIVEELLTSGPLIASNGAIIRSKAGETHWRGLLPVAIAREVLRATPEYRHYTVVTFDQSGEGQFRIEAPANRIGHRAKRHGSVVSETQRNSRQNKEWEGNGGEKSPRHKQRAVATLPGSSLIPPPDGVAASPWIEKYQAAVRFTDSLERELDGDPVEIMFAGPVELMWEVEARLGNLIEAGETKESPRFRLLRTEYPEHNLAILDVIRHDCSKGHAVEFWSKYRGLRREEVMAIGDNYNDLDMLRYAGVPVVMGNSEDALKQQGWPVTLDCDSGGVARAVERYVLGSGE